MKRFLTVPWAPGLEEQQLTRGAYVHLRSTAVVWQLGIGKGFDRETVKARLSGQPRHPSDSLVVELGMLDEHCSGLVEEFLK